MKNTTINKKDLQILNWINISIEGGFLIILDTRQKIKLNDIIKITFKKRNKIVVPKRKRILNYIPFYRLSNKIDEMIFPKVDTPEYVTTVLYKDNFSQVTSIKSQLDVISTSKVIKRINEKLND